MRRITWKSDLKNTRKVKMSCRLPTEADAGVINGCAQLWWLPCSLSGTVESLANTLHKTVSVFLVKTKPYTLYLTDITNTPYMVQQDFSEQKVSLKDIPIPKREDVIEFISNKTKANDIISKCVSIHLLKQVCGHIFWLNPVQVEDGY